MGSAFVFWLLLAGEPLPMDWCLDIGDSNAPMAAAACEFFEEQTQLVRLDASYAALGEATDTAAVDVARAAFLRDRDLGCGVWANFKPDDPSRLSVGTCRMRRLLQRIEEIEEQLRSLYSGPPGVVRRVH